jgi:hypothetical protein
MPLYSYINVYIKLLYNSIIFNLQERPVKEYSPMFIKILTVFKWSNWPIYTKKGGSNYTLRKLVGL